MQKNISKYFFNLHTVFESLIFFKQSEMKPFLKTTIVTLHLKTIENSKSQN